VSPNPAQGTPETFTATLRNVSAPQGTPITFLVGGANSLVKMVRANGNGQASFTYTGVFTGSDKVVAIASANTTLISNDAQVTWTGGQHSVFLTLNPSPTAGTLGKPVTLTASLTDISTTPPAAISGASIVFTLGDVSCVGITDPNGIASCTLTPDQLGFSTLQATFQATGQFLGSTASVGFTTRAAVAAQQQTTLKYTGPTLLAQGQPVTLSAVLTANAALVSGRSVLFTLGSGGSAQTCTGTTDGFGVARCTISVNQPLGPGAITAAFAGDASYLASSTTASDTVFAFVPHGSFVIGDGNAAVGASVTFWSSQWWRTNTVSNGSAPAAFKGFADTVKNSPPACGDTWATSPGNSSAPLLPATVPQYMGVIASSYIGNSGSAIAGNAVDIVVIKTDPGYGPSPGHAGTGTVIGIYCGDTR
jgi:hypothetical protein